MPNFGDPNGKLILVVDDERSALRAVTSTLALAGFRAIVAENGAKGLEAFFADADEIALVLTDIVMPVMDGITMADRIKKARPDARILLMTAYSDGMIGLTGETDFPLIRKPFLQDDLVRAINAQLGSREIG
jgi:DNA-binding NtrC family response regulator